MESIRKTAAGLLARHRRLLLLRNTTRWTVLIALLFLVATSLLKITIRDSTSVAFFLLNNCIAGTIAILILSLIAAYVQTLSTNRTGELDIAWVVDRRLGLNGEFATGLELALRKEMNPIESIVIERARMHAQRIIPRSAIPFRSKSACPASLCLLFLYCFLCMFNLPSSEYSGHSARGHEAGLLPPISSRESSQMSIQNRKKTHTLSRSESAGISAEIAASEEKANSAPPISTVGHGTSPLFGPPKRTPITKRPKFVRPLFDQGRTVEKEVEIREELPDAGAKPTVNISELTARYKRIAEAAVEREPIPPAQKDLVRNYFRLLTSSSEHRSD